MHPLGVCSVLLVFLCLQAEKVQFKLRINEKGTRFYEKVRINEKENTVSFTVPKHNDVDRSEVLNDFNLNLTITRVPDKGICHVKPLEKGLPNPSEIKSDMNYIKNTRARMKGMMVSSSEWTFDKRLKRKGVHPSVAKFCAGLPIYRLRQIIDDDLVTVLGNDTVGRRKRQNKNVYSICPGYTSGTCNPNKWILNCKFKRLGTCVFWMKCKRKIEEIENLAECDFTHKWNSVMCCIPTCS